MVFLSFLFCSCSKSDIAIGLEGTYTMEVQTKKRAYVGDEQNYDDQVHGIYTYGDSAHVGPSSYMYSRDVSIFKLQGKYYLEQNILTRNNGEYSGEHLPLEIKKGIVAFSSPLGNRINNGSPYFKICFDNSTLEGSMIIGHNIPRGSQVDIVNGVIEQASIKLIKK